ncbi:MAG: epoxyqueuosine reductase [Clostridia bacterium]|nr:epoxyqueuosine reductase [Clostridia bacterium]
MLIKDLKRWAGEKGLVLGVAPAQPFKRGKEALQWRVKMGLKTPFSTGKLEERYQPSLLYPEARSIIVVAMANKERKDNKLPGANFIASYAIGPDYHKELYVKLNGLVMLLKQAGAKLAAIQVDSGPLLEREAACLAGIGYYGDNCNLIIKGMGSQASLGLVITDLEIADKEKTEQNILNNCQNCGRCFSSCPTGALKAPGLLNPQLCLSYLTQRRGIIPVEFRPLMTNYIWGCDICQEVCPTNFKEKQAISDWETINKHMDFPQKLQPESVISDLSRIISMDKADFNQIFGNTALAWRGKNILQRNTAIVLGNLANPAALAPLEQAIKSPSAVVRGHAAWALGRLGRVSRHILEKAFSEEKDKWVRHEIKTQLDKLI